MARQERDRLLREASWAIDMQSPNKVDWFRPNTRYIVLRAAPGLPWNFMPEHLDGLWIDRPPSYVMPALPGWHAQGVATGRYERRDDGALAEVYELSPPPEVLDADDPDHH